MIELKLSEIKCSQPIDYTKTKHNCGDYTIRWVVYVKDGFTSNVIHISGYYENPIVRVHLKVKELDEVLKIFGAKLIFDIEI